MEKIADRNRLFPTQQSKIIGAFEKNEDNRQLPVDFAIS